MFKFQANDRVRANEKAPSDYAGHVGSIVARGPGKCEYAVLFDDDQRGVAYLSSWCLDPFQPRAAYRRVVESAHGGKTNDNQ